MKTSNKLLVAFATALILIPILSIAIISRVYFEKGDGSYNAAAMDGFGPLPTNIASIPANGSFETVSIQGDKSMHLAVTLVKDAKQEIKFSDNLKGLLTISTDANSQLLVNIKPNIKSEVFGRIYISSLALKRLKVANTGIELQAEMDSLDLALNNMSSANFNAESKIGQLDLHITDVMGITFVETAIKYVVMDMKNANVLIEKSSFDDLTINSSGTDTIEMKGGDSGTSEQLIKNLKINTLGKSDFKVFNTMINKCSGSFSDSTSVLMPAVNLNQMYKSRK